MTARVASVAEVLRLQAQRLGDQPLLSLAEGTLTFAEVDELAEHTALALAQLGYGPGDVIMARCRNTKALVATWFGANKLGAVFMPVNALLTGVPLRNVVGHSRARVMVCDPGLFPALGPALDGLDQIHHLLVPGGRAAVEGEMVPGGASIMDFDQLMEQGAAGESPGGLELAPPPSDLSLPAKLMYTSGTTGTPKGVLWSRNCEAVWASSYAAELLAVEEGEGLYTCLPMFHVTCQGTVLSGLWRGAHVTVDNGFDAFGFWNRVRRANAVAFTFVGTLLTTLAKRPEKPDDADNPVRWILGSAAPTDLWRYIEERFGVVIVETWGQTETASCWTFPEGLPQEPGTVGVPSSRFEARIVGEERTELPAGQPGELWIKPTQPQVMFERYLHDDEATSSAWTADGWYRTGDLMSRAESGQLSFVGRLRDAIRRRGEMIAPVEIEQATLRHPDVAEVAAVGVPAPGDVEEEVLVCVVPIEGAVLEEEKLHRYLTAALPGFMVPRYIRVMSELPKTPTTRVQKYRLAAMGTELAWDARPGLGTRGLLHP